MNESLESLARSAREEVRQGTLRGAALFELLLSIPYHDRDAFIDALLGLEPLPSDMPNLPRGAVPYWPCGVDEIVEMVRELPLREGDQLVDLGSGLGRVVILAHLLTGARARGIELQTHLVDSARTTCRELALHEVSFVHANAADENVTLDGSIFFLYSPFNGEMLRVVLRRLEEVAQRKRIIVCTVSLDLGGIPWLTQRPSSSITLALYDSDY